MNLANKWLLGVSSAAVVTSLITFEGMKTHASMDIGGTLDVCYGYTGKDIDINKVYSSAECRQKLVTQIQAKQKGVLECIKVSIKQNEYDAYTIFSYNVGVPSFCTSQSAKQLNLGNHIAACKLISNAPNGKPNWSFVDGKYVAGLYKRRQFERDMCLGVSK